MHIAFLGLGGMGQPMAENLVKAGFTVTVWNRSPAPVEALRAQGARVAESPKAIFDADVLITILADDAVTENVVVTQGALASLAPGALWINMATVSVAFTDAMQALARERRVGYLAAPVLGAWMSRPPGISISSLRASRSCVRKRSRFLTCSARKPGTSATALRRPPR